MYDFIVANAYDFAVVAGFIPAVVAAKAFVQGVGWAADRILEAIGR